MFSSCFHLLSVLVRWLIRKRKDLVTLSSLYGQKDTIFQIDYVIIFFQTKTAQN